MRSLTYIVAAPCLSIAISASALAATSATDITGVYACVGHDEHLGAFQEQEDIRLEPAHHASNARGYRVTARIGGEVAYVGEAVTVGKRFALNFISTSDPTNHGVAIGNLKLTSPITLTGAYFGTHHADSDSGTEECERTGN
jgi:hypothetical protein